jgi:outer membrane lipoprotein carrier protein
MRSMRARSLSLAGGLVSLTLAAGAAVASAAVAGVRPDPADESLSATERLRALIDRVKLEQRGLETLEAQFVQRQESSMLVAPEVSRGEFSYAAPDRVRWEYLSPNPISVVIDGTEMTTWYRDLGKAETIKVGRYSNQVFKYLGASGSLETLIDYFRVSVSFPSRAGEPYTVNLVPRYERIARRLDSMTLWLDPRRYLPVRLKYVAADGDLTEYTFRDFKVNAGIPAERFELHLSDGVELKRFDFDRTGR